MRIKEVDTEDGFIDDMELKKDDEDNTEDDNEKDTEENPEESADEDNVVRKEPLDDKEGNLASILVDGWDVDDLDQTIQKYDELLTVYNDLLQLKEKMEENIISSLKNKKWTSYKTLDKKLTVRMSQQKKQVIERDRLIRLLSRSQLMKVIQTSETDYLEIIGDDDKKELKDHAT